MPDTLPHPDLVAALPRLRRYARVLTGDVHRADDLVQDTLARAWEKRRLWRAGSDLRAWLFTIMHNVHVNQFALRQRDMVTASLDAEDGPAFRWISEKCSSWPRSRSCATKRSRASLPSPSAR